MASRASPPAMRRSSRSPSPQRSRSSPTSRMMTHSSDTQLPRPRSISPNQRSRSDGKLRSVSPPSSSSLRIETEQTTPVVKMYRWSPSIKDLDSDAWFTGTAYEGTIITRSTDRNVVERRATDYALFMSQGYKCPGHPKCGATFGDRKLYVHRYSREQKEVPVAHLARWNLSNSIVWVAVTCNAPFCTAYAQSKLSRAAEWWMDNGELPVSIVVPAIVV